MSLGTTSLNRAGTRLLKSIGTSTWPSPEITLYLRMASPPKTQIRLDPPPVCVQPLRRRGGNYPGQINRCSRAQNVLVADTKFSPSAHVPLMNSSEVRKRLAASTSSNHNCATPSHRGSLS